MYFGARRSVALFAAATVAMTVSAGCGDSGDDGGGGSPEASQAADRAERPGEAMDLRGPAAAVQGAYIEFVAAVYANDPRTACEALSTRAQRRFAGPDQTCEKAMRNLTENERLSKNRPYLAKVTVKPGEQKAVARARTKTSNTYPVPFIREQGDWKIDGGF